MKTPINPADIEIGKRLREFRDSVFVATASLARSIGEQRERLASYEIGRAPLPFSIYLALFRRWNISARFLATGEGPMQAWGSTVERVASTVEPKAHFR